MFSKKFDQDFVNKLLKEKEGKSLDFKQKITSKEKIAKTISAMANTEGGLILIGTSDQKKITGIDPEEERYMVDAANNEFCIPKASLSIQEVKINEGDPLKEEKSVLIVSVRPTLGPLIYVLSKTGERKAYRREGDKTLAI
ncbi:helix-turn-helix domain-containing protein [Algoriphagus sp. AK58]|uniref:AlbA family DNA-binding domain-containing protein n=1 Tax=Algoriphagus sp. AK58 TaxID=1406877 RepID=UPI00164F40A4|nr:ATP-binding protein [Algoriphagus sp. AK58]MBC6367921.1 transcriptional regulator [Algoriphagus sp. AK58]